MSDKIVKVDREVGGGAAGLLERALDDKPTTKTPAANDTTGSVLAFLERLNSIYRITLRSIVVNGPSIGGLGPLLVDILASPTNSRTLLVDYARMIVKQAQEDCDASGRETRYIVIAYLSATVAPNDQIKFTLAPTRTDAIVPTSGGQATDDAFGLLGELISKSPAFQQMVARRAAAGASIMQRQPLKKARDWQLPFPRTVIKAKASATIVAGEQAYFRGSKLIMSARRADDPTGPQVSKMYLDALFVGQNRQLSSNAMPIEFFSADNLGSGVRLDTAQPGIYHTLVVSNENDFDVVFDAVLFGKIVI